jgi:peptidoglycan/xylan/chitin deacetylase (PgdA/CDA1 family)
VTVPDDERIAAITFDDGYADFAHAALPALQARSLVSTLYITTGWVEGGSQREPGPSDAMLSWSQLLELDAGGVEVGAHSHSHPQMDTLGTNALRDELRRPKELLEDALGHPVNSFAYPHGYNGPRVRRLTREVGYGSAAAVRNALHWTGEDAFAVSRLTLTRTTTDAELSAWLAGTDATVGPLRESLATKGWRAYRRGRALLQRAPGSDYR